jgi:hypothetical protein
MKITAPAPPPEVLTALRRDLRRLARTSSSLVPSRRVSIAHGLALHHVDIASENPVAPASYGWRFLVFDAGASFWADIIGEAMESVVQGPPVQQLAAVAAQAEEAGAAGEARIVTFGLADAAALWIVGEEEDFWRFSPEIDARCDRAALIEDWKGRANDLARASDGVLE